MRAVVLPYIPTATPPWAIFTKPLHDCLENRKHEYQIQSDLIFSDGNGRLLYVPAFYIADGASIPWLAQIIIPKSGKYNRPATIHDFGYEYGGYFDALTGEFIRFDRAAIDLFYLKHNETMEVAKWNRNTQYKAVRAGAGRAWRRYRKLDKTWEFTA